MAIGSGFGISAGSGFFQKRGFYTSGSLYKRFQLSSGRRLNRQSVRNYTDQIAAAGSAIFGQIYAQSEQMSVLVAQQVQQRIADSVHGKFLNLKV